MSEDPKSKDGGWQPPEPVFRSTEGKTPRTAPGYVDPDDVDTAAPDFREVDTDEFVTEPAAAIGGEFKPTQAPRPQSGGGCFSTVLTMLGVATFVFAVLIAVALYFLLYYTPRSTTF